MTALVPYECHNAYRGLHFDPDGQEWAEFLAEDNNPRIGDGAARSPRAAAATSTPPQPAPSPLDISGGVR